MKSEELPDEYTVPDPYNLFGSSHHNQGDKRNCTSHAFALMMEVQLSNHFKERTLVDVDDLWGKQKKFGTASEEKGDLPDGPYKIATKYGLRFRRDSGKTGSVFLSGNKRVENGIVVYEGWTIREDTDNAMNTTYELQQEIQGLMRQIDALAGGSLISSERIERYLSEFTQRTNTLLTVAALMSGLAMVEPTYLKNFLITSFPLFVLALFFYLLSSRRLNLLSASWTFEQEQYLKKSYINARKWYVLTDLLLISFFVAFVINIYFFAFGTEISSRDIIFTYAVALLVGGMRYFYIKTAIPAFTSVPDGEPGMLATGGPSTDEMYFAGASAPPSQSLSDEFEK